MSDFLDEVAADCVEAEEDLGNPTVTIEGADYTCAPTLMKRNKHTIKPAAFFFIGIGFIEFAYSLF